MHRGKDLGKGQGWVCPVSDQRGLATIARTQRQGVKARPFQVGNLVADSGGQIGFLRVGDLKSRIGRIEARLPSC